MKSSWSERLARQQAWNVSSIPPQPFFPLPPLVEFCGTSIPKLEQEISDYALVHLADHPPHRLEGPCIVFDEGGSKPVYVNDDRSTAITTTGRVSGRIAGTTVFSQKEAEDSMGHYCAISIFENRTLFAFCECRRKSISRTQYELAKVGVRVFIDYLERVHKTATTTTEAHRFLERAFLVAQERIRDKMVNVDDSLFMCGGILTQVQIGGGSGGESESGSSSSSSGNRGRSGSSGSGDLGQQWVFLSTCMPDGPVPIIITNEGLSRLVHPFSLPFSQSPHSLASFSLQHLQSQITLCNAGDVVTVLNHDILSIFDPYFLSKSPNPHFSEYSSWGDVPAEKEPEKIRKDITLQYIGRVWTECNFKVDVLVEQIIHKVVSASKRRTSAGGVGDGVTLHLSKVPPHHLCCAFQASFGRVGHIPKNSVTEKVESRSEPLWEVFRVIPDEGKDFRDIGMVLGFLVTGSLDDSFMSQIREEDFREFHFCFPSPILQLKARWSSKLGTYLLGQRGLIRTTKGSMNSVACWTPNSGEMALMDWQNKDVLSKALLAALTKDVSGICVKRTAQLINESFATFRPDQDLVEVTGTKRSIRIADISTSFESPSGSLEIEEADFNVYINNESKGRFHSVLCRSSKPNYLSSFSENFYKLVDVQSPNTTWHHFLLSLRGSSVELGADILPPLVLNPKEEEAQSTQSDEHTFTKEGEEIILEG